MLCGDVSPVQGWGCPASVSPNLEAPVGAGDHPQLLRDPGSSFCVHKQSEGAEQIVKKPLNDPKMSLRGTWKLIEVFLRT